MALREVGAWTVGIFRGWHNYGCNHWQVVDSFFEGREEMNASRLREIVDLLLELETGFQIQTRLNEANGALQNMISQPQNPDFRTQFSNTLDQLRAGAAQISEELQPTQISLIVEIGGEKFFVDDLAALIDDWIQKNRVTPAVIQQYLQRFLAERQTYI